MNTTPKLPPAEDPANASVKPGWQTTEFWLAAAGMIVLFIDSLRESGTFDTAPQWAVGLLVGAYAIARAVQKAVSALGAAKVEAARANRDTITIPPRTGES